ncbi:MAG TPA: hypothetical protein VN733_07535, partial [Solirubrobacterales bacterium]|nr:hypothetical protein [Solirubrobacterales bacterium]
AKKKALMICGPATITNAIGSTLRKSIGRTLSQAQDALPDFRSATGAKQLQRLLVDARRDPLDAAQGQVAFAALDAAHVSAMDAEDLGKRLLAQAMSEAIGAQVLADSALQVALHERERSRSAT